MNAGISVCSVIGYGLVNSKFNHMVMGIPDCLVMAIILTLFGVGMFLTALIQFMDYYCNCYCCSAWYKMNCFPMMQRTVLHVDSMHLEKWKSNPAEQSTNDNDQAIEMA